MIVSFLLFLAALNGEIMSDGPKNKTDKSSKKMSDSQFIVKDINAQPPLRVAQKIKDHPQMNVGKTIKKLRKQKKMTIFELATRIGYDPGSLSRVETGKQGYTEQLLIKLAHEFGIKVADFFRDDDEEAVKVFVSGHVPLIAWRDVPNKKQEPFDGWGGVDVCGWLSCPVSHSRFSFALTVGEESMRNDASKPSFDDGDIIFVDPCRLAAHKSIVVIRDEDQEEAVFKRLIIHGSSTMLESLNPSWPNRISPISGSVNICGVVIAKVQSLI